MTRKLIIHDGRSERELVLAGTITVGRDPACHISDSSHRLEMQYMPCWPSHLLVAPRYSV